MEYHELTQNVERYEKVTQIIDLDMDMEIGEISNIISITMLATSQKKKLNSIIPPFILPITLNL